MDIDLYSQMQFNKAQSGCADEALSVLQGLGKDDLKDFVNSVFSEANERGISIEKAVKNQTDELGKILQNRLYRLNKQYNLLFDPKNGWFNQIKEKKISLRDVLSKNTLKLRGRNVETVQEAIQVKLRQQFLGPLNPRTQEMLMSGKFDSAVGEYLMTGKVPKGQEEIRDIGDSLKNLVLNCKTELVGSTAMGIEGLNKYRQLPASYEPLKLQKAPKFFNILGRFKSGQKISMVDNTEAKAQFVENMQNRVGLKAMFGQYWQDDGVVREAFSQMYDRIIRSGRIVSNSMDAVKDEPEIAKRQRMFVIWKDWGSYVEHIQEYGSGTGTLYEQAMSEINSVGRKAGMARVLGADSNWAFNELRKAEIETTGKEPFWKNPVNIFKNLNGSANVPYRPYLAQMQANFNAYVGMVKQIPLTILSLNDTNFGLAALSEITKSNECQNFITKMKATAAIYKAQLTKGEVDPNLKRMLDNSFHSLQHDMGAHMRFIDHQNLGGITRKITDKFYKWCGMSGKDAGNRAGAMLLASKALADAKSASWEDLHGSIKKRLNAYNVTPAEWDVVRANASKGEGDIGDLVLADDVFNISDDQIQTLAQKLGKSANDTRNDLFAKVYGWLNSVADETVLTPGAEENAMLYFGTQPGTVPGMMFRAFGQFKGFLLSYVNRILINGLKDPVATKYRWALSNFLYTVPLTMVGNIFYNASQGRDLNLNPADWDLNTWAETLVPGLSMFSKVLDPRDENSNAALSLLQSPSIGALGDLLAGGASTVNLGTGAVGKLFGQNVDLGQRAKRVRSKAARITYDFTPINSIPYLAPWWRQNAISTKQ